MRVGITRHRGLPEDIEEKARALLAEQVERFDAADLVGISRIADGPDAWWAEAVLKVGGRLEGVVSFWDRKPSCSFGGTADVVAYAERMRAPCTVVWEGGER
ncbi:hypothetical protein [Streptomyces sp. NPDC004629]|uniref:hypothetical protein n=1 Tax=Streptomyces sp. NPDC004629 TaxID=3364705 RepID=UPI0036C5198F